MGCNSSKNKIRPLDEPLPQNKSWFGANIKGQARKLRRKFIKCFKKDEKRSKKAAETAESNLKVTADRMAYMFVPTTFKNVHMDVVKLIILMIALARLLEFIFAINLHKPSHREPEPAQKVSRFRDLAKYPCEEPSRIRRSRDTPPVRKLAVLPPPPSYKCKQTTIVKKTRDEIRLDENLSLVGFDRDPVARDGECFFTAAARQLGRGDPRVITTAQQLRQDLVRYIRADPDRYSVAVLGDSEAFLQELESLAQPGHWCSNLADTLPFVLANFTAREVNLVTSIPNMPVITIEPDGEESGSPIVMSYLNVPGGEHYDAVKRKDD
ncbi:Hypp3756 [Branchiostoma lanceolatum]|uniref:Small ribosomal subunit protein mS31 n=1 Tax=Branchiostoma lanceolatum TaxID=7740 RepID=A0A8K0A214_BRALA|nr:Hypp3756 [Branchiostoma lanceolatum]